MIDYMKKHENYVKEMLGKKLDEEKLKELLSDHDKQIQWMQHERLVHLIVMLFVCLFTLLSFCIHCNQNIYASCKSGRIINGLWEAASTAAAILQNKLVFIIKR